MKFKIKFKTVLNNGNKKTLFKTFTSDKILDEDEQLDFVDDTDMSDWMYEKNVSVILDFFVCKEKPLIPYLPVDIVKDDYDGGWLSPAGELYAMKGDYDDYIHISIAEKLYKNKIIPNNKETKFNPSLWLETNGWAKIHGKYIHYDGYERRYNSDKIIPLTPEQINAIYTHGQVKCKGILSFGLCQKTISAARFEMTEPLMLHKLFE